MKTNAPQYIILDIAQAVQEFKQAIQPFPMDTFFVNTIIDTIILCVQDVAMAEYQLREFAAEIEMDEHSIPIHIAPFVLKLGLDILALILDGKMYNPNGDLMYNFSDLNYDKPINGGILQRMEN